MPPAANLAGKLLAAPPVEQILDRCGSGPCPMQIDESKTQRPKRRIRKLVTKCALWHSGRPIRRAGGPRDFRDLGFLRARRGRRAENRVRACHRAHFVTNLRSPPCPPAAEPPPAGSVSTLV